MPLNGASLGTEIMAALDALADADKADRAKVFDAMGKAIVSHIKTNGKIDGDVNISSATGMAGAYPITTFSASTTLSSGKIS